MSIPLPRKRVIMAFHRWIGAGAAVFVMLLAVTGLLLNHSERLGLNETNIRIPYILNKYNMLSSDSIQSVLINDQHSLSILDGTLYYDSEYITDCDELIGYFSADSFLVVATTLGLAIISNEGELVEQLDFTRLPFKDLKLVGVDGQGRAVLVSDNGNWTPDEDWLEFQPSSDEFKVQSLVKAELDPDRIEAILSHYQGKGPSLYRVLLDLHSGRLFGWKGRTMMDLTAISMLLLVISGLSGWLRKSRRSTTSDS